MFPTYMELSLFSAISALLFSTVTDNIYNVQFVNFTAEVAKQFLIAASHVSK